MTSDDDDRYDVHDYSEDIAEEAYIREASRTAIRAGAILIASLSAMMIETVFAVIAAFRLPPEGQYVAAAYWLLLAAFATVRLVRHRRRKGKPTNGAGHSDVPARIVAFPLTVLAVIGVAGVMGWPAGIVAGFAFVAIDLGFRRWTKRGLPLMEAIVEFRRDTEKNTWEA